VRVNHIHTFDQLISRYGQGHGCEICKPLVASVLASCWNEYLLKPAHLPLQDTNDRYFANIQKDGTYSVVPRMAAGEVTPDGLIAIGQIAKRYQLYSKITGGQRIDLFGARLEELPAIWRELAEAGFETGHAYGKSLRTVKSCVGSTWCRYGVQDSTALAVTLEHRYKGLRAPHKIKMAVSGCTRECAEAQGKDIGVIATEKGWNLYVCGNGGMKPRHGDLFASDLDDATLIRTVDRLLMFYIRTADRLQRTSTWMDNLEGGIDYLREVILEDSLGIGEELEQEMARVVASYQCEWQTTLNDPQRLALFRPMLTAIGRMRPCSGKCCAVSRSRSSRRYAAKVRCRPGHGRPFANWRRFPRRPGSARGWASGRLRCFVLANRFMPSTTWSPVATPTCCRAACWAMPAGSRWSFRRCINIVSGCATGVPAMAVNRWSAPGR
jgi:nitrite reductase (NADH) large subunit